MAYGDTVDPKNRIIALILVLGITAFIGYGLMSGLAVDVAKKVFEKTKAFNIEEPPPPPPPETPPPPKEPKPEVAPPVVIPKSPIQRPTENKVEATNNPPPSSPPTNSVSTPTPNPPAPPPPPPPPAPPAVDKSRAATLKGSLGSYISNDDYPSGAQREERQGTSRVSITVGPDGRVAGCQASGAGGDLDSTACSVLSRRARFNPALDKDGNPTTGRYSVSFKWVLQ